MTKVYQTKFVKEHGIGNCLQAALASILDMPLNDVPEFIGGESDEWVYRMKEFINEQGYNMVDCNINDGDEYMLVIGGSPRGSYDHAVIYKCGKLEHDPYPNGRGVKKVSWAAIITKNTP